MKLFACAAMAAMLGLPTVASADNESVVISGSLINWYYYGRDYTGSTSGDSWNQQPTGGGAWIEWFDDGTYVTHPTGASNYGLMSFYVPGEKRPLDPLFLIRNHILYSNSGGVYTGDAYYSFFMSEQGWEDNMGGEYGSESYVVKVRRWTWDGENPDGSYKNVQYEQVATMTTQPIDLTYDPYNDVVYGIFYDGNTYKVGTLDMETFKVTNISREGIIYGAPQCIAINSKGELYAIDASGNVYTVSKTDGKLTTIGNVGFKSQNRRMSATFDFRTDKLYWVGFMNNGKKSADTSGTNNTLSVADGGRDTGVYEVDTQTGKATLLGKTDFIDVDYIYDESGQVTDVKTNKYGKMQLTGIYVENSFTKKENDLRIMLKSFSAQLKAGEQGKVTVNVKNIGQKTVRGAKYVVKCYVGGELIGTINNDGDEVYTRDLDKGVSQDYSFNFTASKSGHLEAYAEVEFEADEQLSNNKSEAANIVVLSGKTLPNVTLQGVLSNGALTLNWSNPQGHVCDGAEDYAAFSYDGLNDWTMVDGDKGYTQKPSNLFGTVDYPNWNTPKAYIVMDPYKAGLGPDLNGGGEKFLPHSGNQYFAGFYSANKETQTEVDNDDYMISPLLNGEAQTLSFWAKGYRGVEATGQQTDMSFNETLEVLYTTDANNLDPTTYTVIKETFKVNDKAWEQYTVELPAGAMHFALHRNSKAREYAEWEGSMVEVPETGSFIMMIDDIEYKVAAMEVTGYKVYKNGTLVTTLDTNTTTYSPRRIENSDYFTVTAVYGDMESSQSNKVSIDILTDIKQIVNTTEHQSKNGIYDLQGRRVSKLQKGLYIINGQKVIIK